MWPGVPGSVCLGSGDCNSSGSNPTGGSQPGVGAARARLGTDHTSNLVRGGTGSSWGVVSPSLAWRTLEHLTTCHNSSSGNTHSLALHLSCVPDVCHFSQEACPADLEPSNA